jgi:hypothetical protein
MHFPISPGMLIYKGITGDSGFCLFALIQTHKCSKMSVELAVIGSEFKNSGSGRASPVVTEHRHPTKVTDVGSADFGLIFAMSAPRRLEKPA